jgi:hypothetical protein
MKWKSKNYLLGIARTSLVASSHLIALKKMSLSTRNLEELREVFADIPNTEGVSMLQRIARLYLYRLNQQNLTSADGTRTDFILV